MRKFMAIVASGNSVSGIQTREKALQWATEMLATLPKTQKVYIAEIQEVVERSAPPIAVTPFQQEPLGHFPV